MNLNFKTLLIGLTGLIISTFSYSQSNCDAQFSYSYTTCDSIFFYVDTIDPQASYSWYFGDGNTGTGYYTSNQYTGDGSYNVTVIMQNNSGCIDTAYATVIVDCSNSCIIHPDFNATDSTDCYVFFEGMATGGNAPYSYNWDFGDGNTGTGQYPNHLYSNGGTYNVCLTVVDSNGCDTTYCKNILADCNNSTNCTVTPDFTYASDSVGCGLYFNSSIFGGTAPYSYYWDFGDGSTSVAENPYHVFNATGTYNVCLTVFDANGCDSSWCENVTVNCTPNNNCIMHPYFTTQSDSTGCGIDFTSSNSGGSTPYSYYWDFGDGATSYAQTPYHSYNASGNYNVCLTITDANGCDSTYCDAVTVNCGTLNINEDKELTELHVYPNPGTGLYTIELSEEAEIELFNISGKMILSKKVNAGKISLDITNQVSGIYLLRVVSDSKTRTIKIIKR